MLFVDFTGIRWPFQLQHRVVNSGVNGKAGVDDHTSIAINARGGVIVYHNALSNYPTAIDTKILKKDTYYYSIAVDGVKIKGGQIAVE